MDNKRYKEICDACGVTAGEISDKRAAALSILASGQVPPNHIKTRKAPGGKVLSYFTHHWANQLLIDAFGLYGFSYEVLETTFYDIPEGVARQNNTYKGTTATARVKLTIYKDMGGRVLPIVTTALGTFRNDQGYNPGSACASAASLALAKCMIRRFGFLLDRYSDPRDEKELTPKQAWAAAIQYSEQRGVTEADLVVAIKRVGITGNEVASRYDEIWQIVGELAGQLPEAELPAALTDTLPEPEYGEGVDATETASLLAEADILFPKTEELAAAAAETLVEGIRGVDPVVEVAEEPKDQPAIANWGQFYGHICSTYPQFSSGSQVLRVIDQALKPGEKIALSDAGKWSEVEAKVLAQLAKNEKAAKEKAAKQK